MEHKIGGSHKKVYREFLTLGVALTFSFGFVFLAGQQIIRMQANDPQVEIVEGVSEALNQGQDPSAFGSLNPTDIAKSLAPFVIVLDQDGKVISGTAVLDGQMPIPPKALLDASKAGGERRTTWQPRKGVRVATVIKPVSFSNNEINFSGFVLAGKSLREATQRTQILLQITGIAWVVSLLAVWLTVMAIHGKKEEHVHHEGEHHEHHHA